MAFEPKVNELFCILFVILFGVNVTSSTNIDCNGKPFHCVNTTHFMICVDLGAGVSSAIEDFIIPCPPSTACQVNNDFECEYVPTSTITPSSALSVPVSAVLNDATDLDWEVIEIVKGKPEKKQNEIEFSEKYFDSVSFSTQNNSFATNINNETEKPPITTATTDISDNNIVYTTESGTFENKITKASVYDNIPSFSENMNMFTKNNFVTNIPFDEVINTKDLNDNFLSIVPLQDSTTVVVQDTKTESMPTTLLDKTTLNENNQNQIKEILSTPPSFDQNYSKPKTPPKPTTDLIQTSGTMDTMATSIHNNDDIVYTSTFAYAISKTPSFDSTLTYPFTDKDKELFIKERENYSNTKTPSKPTTDLIQTSGTMDTMASSVHNNDDIVYTSTFANAISETPSFDSTPTYPFKDKELFIKERKNYSNPKTSSKPTTDFIQTSGTKDTMATSIHNNDDIVYVSTFANAISKTPSFDSTPTYPFTDKDKELFIKDYSVKNTASDDIHDINNKYSLNNNLQSSVLLKDNTTDLLQVTEFIYLLTTLFDDKNVVKDNNQKEINEYKLTTSSFDQDYSDLYTSLYPITMQKHTQNSTVLNSLGNEFTDIEKEKEITSTSNEIMYNNKKTEKLQYENHVTHSYFHDKVPLVSDALQLQTENSNVISKIPKEKVSNDKVVSVNFVHNDILYAVNDMLNNSRVNAYSDNSGTMVVTENYIGSDTTSSITQKMKNMNNDSNVKLSETNVKILSQKQIATFNVETKPAKLKLGPPLVATLSSNVKKTTPPAEYFDTLVLNVLKNTNNRTNETIHQNIDLNKNSNNNITKKNISNDFFTSPNKQKLENNSIPFNCTNLLRGKYADIKDCRKYYICIGLPQPMVGLCPLNTVFSQTIKQCIKNTTLCTANKAFYCEKEGKFPDNYYDNIYYICVKRQSTFLKYKLQCQNDYKLNKTTVACEQNDLSSQSLSTSVDSQQQDKNQKENKSEKKKIFECKQEGKFPDPDNCKNYYVCKENKSELRLRLRQCDADEVYNKEKEKCVDMESYNC